MGLRLVRHIRLVCRGKKFFALTVAAQNFFICTQFKIKKIFNTNRIKKNKFALLGDSHAKNHNFKG